MAGSVLLNGNPVTGLPVTDRGLAYGDGVFETIRMVGQVPLLWGLHWERLQKGCETLRIPLASDTERRLKAWIEQLMAEVDPAQSSVIKIIVTRGSGGRGYRPGISPANILVSHHPMPDGLERLQRQAILKCLNYRLPSHPVLAGIKHLNRLDQVLASLELGGEDEGLLLDLNDRVIEGTRTNLLLSRRGRLVTPDLCMAGVEGVMRRYLLEHGQEHGISISVETVSRDELTEADGLAIMNSVMGICCVTHLDGRSVPRCQAIIDLQHSIHKTLGF